MTSLKNNSQIEKSAEDARQGDRRKGVIKILAASLLLALLAAILLSYYFKF